MTGPASAKPFTLYEDGFADDRFGRKTAGEKLSAVLGVNTPLVIALHGQWGTGKTHFLKRWVGEHAQRGGTTLYFDAFASDYQSDPLVALVAALAGRLPKRKKTLSKIKKAVEPFLKPAARIGIAVATGGGSELVGAVGDAAIAATGKEAEKAVEAFWAREEGRTQAMAQFRAALSELTGTDEAPTPLVIVIDELDRCRPDYALELLEVIKHFFEVPRVHFVLGVNLDALENAVRARYGSGIEAEEYLRKFISFRVTLPAVTGYDEQPVVLEYAKMLAKRANLSREWSGELLESLKAAAGANALTLRDVEKIIAQMLLVPVVKSSEAQNVSWVKAACDLLVMKVIRPDIYAAVCKGEVDFGQFKAYFTPVQHHPIATTGGARASSSTRIRQGHLQMWEWLLAWPGVSDDMRGRFARNFDCDVPEDREICVRKIANDWLDILSLS